MDLLSSIRRRLRLERMNRDFARYNATRPVGCEWFSDDRSEHGADMLSQLPSCDVITLHWVASFIDYRKFFTTVPKHTPVVWRLADMNAFTGGCHYTAGCDKYMEGCGSCPQLGSNKGQDLSNQIWQRKRAAFSCIEPGKGLHIVAPTQWMANEVRHSSLLCNHPVTVIPNGLDIRDFAPRDRHVARAMWEIPQDSHVVLFVACEIGSKRKGLALLIQAVAGLGDLPNLLLVSVGGGKPDLPAQIPHLHLGDVDNERCLSVIYSAADLFVIPSLEDNMPATVLESLACGTPVVGFAVGGIPEMVRPGVTGLLAPPQDVGALRSAIVALLQDPGKRAEMAADCRRVAVREYSSEVQARRYVELYETILDHR